MYLFHVRGGSRKKRGYLLNSFEVELFLHTRIVGIVDVGLIQPLDEVCRVLAWLIYSFPVKAVDQNLHIEQL